MKRLHGMEWLALALCACGGAQPPDVGPRSTLDSTQAAAARQACMFGKGTLPGLSLAKDAPLGSEIPIDTIVIVAMENRSFDHLFGHLPEAGVTDVEVAPTNASNMSSAGVAVPWHHDDAYCFCDTNHEWDGSHLEWNGGRNDGFVKANEGNGGCPPDGSRAMSYYTKDDLGWLYSLATEFAISDHNFSSLLGPTFPNREYLYAATSFGHTGNSIFTQEKPTILEALNAAKVSWHDYWTTLPAPGIFTGSLTKYLNNVDKIESFYSDAAAGNLASVVFVDPDLRNEWGGGEDFHPPGDVQNGQSFLAKVVHAVETSPQWPHLAMFITFDESGGIYDHVPPPSACPPDDIPPLETDDMTPRTDGSKFDRYGFRVPLIVVSPYAKAGHVSHVVSDHTSILRFVESRFVMGALTARDANADPLFDLFDFSSPKLLTPPTMAAPVIDPAKLQDCSQTYPNTRANLFPDAGTPPVDGGATD